MEAKFKDDPKTKLGGITDIPETIIPSANNNNYGMYVWMDGWAYMQLYKSCSLINAKITQRVTKTLSILQSGKYLLLQNPFRLSK